MKRRIVAAMTLMALTLSVAGCGSSSSTSASASSSADSTAAASESTTVSSVSSESADASGEEVSTASSTSESVAASSSDAVDPSEYTDWNWPSVDKLNIGYSQADNASTWRTVESDSLQEACDAKNIPITIVNANGDTNQQLSDVESLISQGCNVIVITAIDADAIQPALDECRDQKIPVLLKSRGSNGVPGVDYVTFMASDFVFEGESAANWMIKQAKTDGIDQLNVCEVQGVIGGTDVRDRSQGFHNVADAAGVNTVVQQSANWSRTEAQELASNVLSSHPEVNAFFCQNDEMALGVSLAVQSAGLTVGKDVYIVGIDGMKESLDAIKAGTQSASITCTPKFGPEFLEHIIEGCEGQTLKTYYKVDDKTVDITNVDEFYDLGF